jgi:diguanylate cyclase (GGDEF)-like protein/PAS domain S-box-containing protein
MSQAVGYKMSDNANFRIIIIDDNPSIHMDFIKILKTESFEEIDNLGAELFGHAKQTASLPKFEISVASQGEEGVQRIKESLDQGKPFALAFVDIRMPPGLDGIETIKKIWEIDKNIQVVICTAYSDYSWEETISHLGKTDNLLILKKPFDNISVRQLASALTTKWQLSEKTRNYTEQLKEQVATRTLSLQKSLSLVKSTFESSSDGIIVVGDNGTITDYNNQLINMLQIPQAILDSNQESDFLDYVYQQLEQSEEFIAKMHELHVNKEEISIDVIKFKNGKIFECYSQPHKLDQETIGRILNFRDITKRAILEKELEYQATHDALTGLDNRVKLHEKMKIAIKNAEKTGSTFGVLFIDFDRFKLINDSLSHAVGDELLKSVSERLSSTIHPEDTLARLGGDEFVIILMDIPSNTILQARVGELIGIFQLPFNLGTREVVLTASIGVSVYPDDGETVDVLLRNADVAMYRAKAYKGNNFKLYAPEMNVESLAILDHETQMRQGLQRDEFFLCYQPQMDSVTGQITALEALIRWQHPTKGLLLPIDFIPLAEETGLIVPLGEWVLRMACAQNKAWQTAGHAPVRIAVNITEHQFQQYNLVEMVKSVLHDTKLDPRYLELELTENVILKNPAIIRVITELKNLGIVIAVDDFGTGYSSLSYLHKIPLDRLKIDGSFIQSIESNSGDEVVIRAIISMAQNLNLEVLVEGVETLDQVNFLKKYKCNDVQGYYFSKPLTKTEMEAYLDTYSPDLPLVGPTPETKK